MRKKDKALPIISLNLEKLFEEKLNIQPIDWWTNLMAYSDSLYISKYEDQKDPNRKRYYRLGESEASEIQFNDVPDAKVEITQPSIFDLGSESLSTVEKYLSKQLPLPCEYFEKEQKIIMSYYLRSKEAFSRYLRYLDGTEVILDCIQDESMKGFASGSFFVLSNRLIFVRNRNEIVVYTI